jgi:large conductance mechanosensitive channel
VEYARRLGASESGRSALVDVRPVNALMARRRTEPPVDATTRQCPECLSEIPREARRCAFCTAEVGPAVATA